MKIYIKNMVCQGTSSFVLLEMRKLGSNFKTFKLGEIDFEGDLSSDEINELHNSMATYGLEITFPSSNGSLLN